MKRTGVMKWFSRRMGRSVSGAIEVATDSGSVDIIPFAPVVELLELDAEDAPKRRVARGTGSPSFEAEVQLLEHDIEVAGDEALALVSIAAHGKVVPPPIPKRVADGTSQIRRSQINRS